MQPLKLVVVSAGLGKPSSTRLLGDRLAEAVRERLVGRAVEASTEVEVEIGRGVEVEVDVEVLELRDLAVDIAHNLVSGYPAPALRAAIDAVTAADALIAVTPIFTASYSGLFKSFFDVVDNTALIGKPVLVAATGGTARHSLALEFAVRPLFAYLRASVVPTAVYAATDDWGSGGGADGLGARITRAGAELADLVTGAPRPARPAAAPAFEDVIPFADQLAAVRRG